MSMRVMLIAAIAALGFAGTANASLIPIGSALSFGGTDLPGACTNTTCSDTTTFGGTVAIDGGALTLTTSQVADGPNAEWDVWSITSATGGPVAGDTSGNWAITMSYVLAAGANFDAVMDQWSKGGTAIAPTGNIGGICCATATNPSPLSGPGFYASGFSSPLAAGTVSDWNQIFVNPYSFIIAGGIPIDADEFSFALHFTAQTPVPEPASLALLASGLLGLGLARRGA
jgi:hypothetical protein